PAERLGDDVVEDPQLHQVPGGQPQRLRGQRLGHVVGLPPEDARAPLGADDRVPGVLQHAHPVADADAPGPPPPPPPAPPDPPAPIPTQTPGVGSRAIPRMFVAMSCACPRSSAPMPGKAPGVSIRQTTGRPNLAASRILPSALRYPSGWAQP